MLVGLRSVLQALVDLLLEGFSDDFPVEFLRGSDQTLEEEKTVSMYISNKGT
jgi:hypothetical protein